jgi:hypothetical protein
MCLTARLCRHNTATHRSVAASQRSAAGLAPRLQETAGFIGAPLRRAREHAHHEGRNGNGSRDPAFPCFRVSGRASIYTPATPLDRHDNNKEIR